MYCRIIDSGNASCPAGTGVWVVNSDDERTLAQFLGLGADEEDVWIDDSDEALKAMLDRERCQS